MAALDGTFQRLPFGAILDLVPLSEKVVKLTAVCAICGADASFTQRIISSSQIQLIGGEESYRPVCRKCYKLDPAAGYCSRVRSGSRTAEGKRRAAKATAEKATTTTKHDEALLLANEMSN